MIDEKLIDSIIRVAYGDAGIADKIIVSLNSLINSEVKKILNDYKQTADEVHSLAENECPDEVVTRTEKEIKLNKRKEPAAWFAFSRPITAMAALILVAAIASFFIFKQKPVEGNYSTAEVITAEKQVKESLAIVGRVFKRTENTLTEDVLARQVTPPFHKSYETINNLLKGG